MNDNAEAKILELREILEFLKKDNKYIRSENDNLIKQNKLHSNVIETLRARIDNLNNIISDHGTNDSSNFELTDRNFFQNDNTSFNNNAQNEKEAGKNKNDESSGESNDKIEESNENGANNIDNGTSHNENELGNNDNLTLLNDNQQQYNENQSQHNEKRSESNENQLQRNDSQLQRNDSQIENNENQNENNENEVYKSRMRVIVNENIKRVFKKKFINKVTERFTNEVLYLNSGKKITVQDLLVYTHSSIATLMRDIRLFKKKKWVIYSGRRDKGHYKLTEEGKKLTVKRE